MLLGTIYLLIMKKLEYFKIDHQVGCGAFVPPNRYLAGGDKHTHTNSSVRGENRVRVQKIR